MAGSEWDWFQREELIGQITDLRVQNLQVERENVQKRTFTRWINLHLEKCSPPLEVKNLLVDIKDGKILMALLEVLSGQNLLQEYKPSTHRIFRLNNIAKALRFLEDSNVKLVSIDAAEIADGNSSMILGLIWNIILFFQIKELTGNLNRNSSSSSLSSGPSGPDSDTSHPNTPNVERSMSVSVKDQRRAIKALLTWVQRKTRKYGVAVQDFASSWRSGLAFLAVIKAINSSLVDMKQALEKTSLENLEDAFSIAQHHLGIPRLLEPEDVMVESPDEQSIMTYVAQFLEHFPELEGEDFSDLDKEFPVESTYAHVTEIPEEEKEKKVLILSENGEHTYTGHLDRSQSPPLKVHILGDQEKQDFHMANDELGNHLDQPLLDHSETFIEPRRPSALSVMELVSQSGSVSDNAITSEGDQKSISDPAKLADDLPPAMLKYRRHSVDQVDSQGFTGPKSTSETKESWERRTRSLPWSSHPHKNMPEHLRKELECPVPDSQEKEAAHKYILEMLHQEISKLPENNSMEQTLGEKDVHATDQKTDGSDVRDASEVFCLSEHLSLPVRNTPKSLDVTNENGPMDTVMPNSSKVSVIPHELFYYPHYDVPISAVLDAFATPNSDLEPDPSLAENNKICTKLLENCLAEEEPVEQDLPKPDLYTSVKVTPADRDDKGLERLSKETHDHKKSSNNKPVMIGNNMGPKVNSHAASPQDSTHPDIPAIVVNQYDRTVEERKMPEERSKKKEKRKNKAITQGENSQIPKIGSPRLLDKSEEEPSDHQGFSRISHSDPNVLFQRNVMDLASKESDDSDLHSSMTTSESTSTARKRKEAPEKPAPPSSTTSRTEQPDLFYFIVFLWIVVYCLLLLPQLVGNTL